jgi:hypothetical protein
MGESSVQKQSGRNREDSEAADSILVQLALYGDQEAFEALMNRYKQSLFDLIY